MGSLLLRGGGGGGSTGSGTVGRGSRAAGETIAFVPDAPQIRLKFIRKNDFYTDPIPPIVHFILAQALRQYSRTVTSHAYFFCSHLLVLIYTDAILFPGA